MMRNAEEEGLPTAAGAAPAGEGVGEDELYAKISLLADSFDGIYRLGKKDFLKGVFDAAFALIPEAQKGSLYELVGERFVPVFSKGYDAAVLGRLSFGKDEAFIDFECRNPTLIDAYESRIERRDDRLFSPETIATFKELGTYSGFISLYAPIQIEGSNAGIICLENFDGVGYSKMSKKILKFYARLISSFYSRIIHQEQETKLYTEKIGSLRLLAAGVAHELNTPLGALLSAAASLGAQIAHVIPRLAAVRGMLSGPEYATVERLILEGGDGEAGAPAPREVQRRLSRELAGSGARHAEELADAFAVRGFQSIPDEYLRLFSGGNGEPVAEIFLDLHDIRQLIAVTRTATEKAAGIVRSLGTYTHVQTTESVGPVDLARQLDAVILSMSPPLAAGIAVARDFRPCPPAAGDEDRLRLVWRNLLRNAAQAMEGRGRLGVGVSAEGSRAVVSIADDGSGIPLEIRGQVFDPFFTTKGPGLGAGLGLSIAKAIVESCEGSIGFESSPKGTVFRVELPAWEGRS